MVIAERCLVYEQNALLDVTGNTIRPGGLALTERAISLCSLPAGARVLDVGCGVGATVEYLATHHHLVAVGVDPSARLLQSGRRRTSDLPLTRSVGERLPIRDGQMDAVLAECSLSVMVNADQVLEECHRVLKARGSLIISDIYARNPEGIADLHCLSLGTCLRGAKSQQGVISQLQAHGFEIMLWEDHSGVLRHLTAQLIMSHSSIEQFWCQMSSGTVDPVEIRVAITRARPGYYLLIASKTPQRSTFFLTQRCEKPELDVGGNGG